MSGGDHRRFQALLVAYVLDRNSLDADERNELEAHLEGCEICRAEEKELRSVAAALDTVSADETFAEPSPYLEDEIVASIVAEREDLAASRRERRSLWRRPQFSVPAVGLVAAVVFVLVAVVFPFFSGSGEPAGLGETEEIAFTGAPQDVTVEAAVIPHTWGTELDLEVEGLEPGEVYSVKIEDRSGDYVEAGTFVAVQGITVDCEMNGAVLRQDARTILVTDSGGETVMRADLDPAPALASVT